MIRRLANLISQRETERVSALLVLGAGKCVDLPVLRQLNAARTVLVEAHPILASLARRRMRASLNEEVWCAAITTSEEPCVLHTLSQWKLNSLRLPEGLFEYYPNVVPTGSIEVSSRSFERSIEKLELRRSDVNVLVLDLPGQGADLIESAKLGSLLSFKWVVVRCSEVPLFTDEVAADRIIDLLEGFGFSKMAESAEAIFPERVLLFARDDSLVEINRLKNKIERMAGLEDESSKMIRLLQQKLDNANQVITKNNELVFSSTRNGQNLGGEQDSGRVSPAIPSSGLEGPMDSNYKEGQWFERELDKLREVFKQDLSRATKDIYRRVDKATITAAKQVEAFIGVHNYFATGHLPSLSTESHSWPVSPDFALYMVELIEKNDYDLVVEFGSGVSTVVLAKALERKRLSGERESPVPLTSFEHLEEYFEETASRLAHARASEQVDLVLAPLRPYQAPDGVSYLYYDCVNVIHQLSKRCVARDLRVLVVIDGPPGKTCKHARYPAMPILLSSFTNGQLDFLLDDYARAEEAEVVEMWGAYLSGIGVGFDVKVRKLQKDACLVSVRLANEL